MEIINNILIVGMVPALFENEEKTLITNEVKSNAISAGYENNKYVLNKVKKKNENKNDY